MPTLIKEDGTRPAGSNAYADLTDANSYVDSRAYGLAAWNAKSDDDKRRFLITATLLIDTFFEFTGYIGKVTQLLRWPRVFARNPEGGEYRVRNPLQDVSGSYYSGSEIPVLLVRATCEQAFQLALSDRTEASANEGINSVEIFQAIKVQFDRNEESAPPITALVQEMLAGIGTYRSSKSGAVRLSRA